MSDGAPSFVVAAGLRKVYRSAGGDCEALRGVNLDVGRGEFAAIIGPSGCGKSTLLYVLGGLTAPTAGTVRVAGERLDGLGDAALSRLRGKTTGFVFQRFNLLPTLSVRDNLVIAQRIRGLKEEGVDALLARVGLSAKSRRRPSELSTGEQQRAAIARALAHRPALLLADEPTGNLDSCTSARILDLLGAMHRDLGQTILLVTHDPGVAAAAGRIIRMRDGRIEPL